MRERSKEGGRERREGLREEEKDQGREGGREGELGKGGSDFSVIYYASLKALLSPIVSIDMFTGSIHGQLTDVQVIFRYRSL